MLNVTDRALSAIQSVCAEDGETMGLRIMVMPGGCSGLQYRMGLESESSEGDEVLEFAGTKVFVDPSSVMWLTGATMDYVEGSEGAGFIFENPNAGKGCSCSTKSC